MLTARAVRAAAGVALAGRAGAEELAALLYRAGSAPVTERWVRLWHPSHVELAMRDAVRSAGLDERYRRHGTPHWHAMERADLAWTGRDALRHKVYVSPEPGELFAALHAVLAAAVALDVPALKVGATTQGVLRPDAIVLYHRSPEHAQQVAERIAADVDGLAARGVPFTGQVGRTGAVSRGTDPSHGSWRSAVTTAVATAVLHAARSERTARAGSADQTHGAVEAVVARTLSTIASFGLDVTTWWPPLRVPRRLEGRRSAA
ncbi:hypothetical protein GCM10028814_10040 [Angustibacter aerolatus]